MAGPTEEITIRELNLEMIAPSTKTMYIDKQGGSKTIVLGKPGCFAPGTKVLMFNGDIKPIETIKVGDVVMIPGDKGLLAIQKSGNTCVFFNEERIFGICKQVENPREVYEPKKTKKGKK